MQKLISRHTHIGRALDPRYPTNLAILIWGSVVAVLMFGVRLGGGADFIEAGFEGFLAATAVVIAWVLSRELDPQEELAAFVSAFLMSAALFIVDTDLNILLLVFIIPTVRLINRTFGLPATLNDAIVIAGFAAVIAYWGHWSYALLGGVAFLADSFLPESKNRLPFAALSFVIAVAVIIIRSAEIAPDLPSAEYLILMIVVILGFVPVILRARTMRVPGDVRGTSVHPTRIQAGQMFIMLFGLVVAIWQGDAGFKETLTLWLSLAGVALFPAIKPFIPQTWIQKIQNLG